ncbi:MAG TPA: type IV pilus assembly protein PilM [Rubrobacteraceae bacterium]|nr:type IV pilus assembly protein PilM [Rubrobacteraceae bacterium]
MMGRFRAQAVGMDIDHGAIKAVQVSSSGGDYTLQHVGYRRLPPGTITEGEVADHDLLASEIQEFWSTHGFRGKTVVLGLSNQKVVVRLLDFPHMDPEDLKSAIGFEAQVHIPMPIDEAVLDHVVLGPQEEGSDLDRILIVAAQRDMVSRFTSAVRTAGLRPIGVDVKALSLLRSTLPETLFDEGATLLLDVGSEITNLIISQEGNPTLTRFIMGGSNQFVQTIAEVAGIEEEDAERRLMDPKLRIGDYPEDESSAVDGEPESEESEEDTLDPARMFDIRRGLEDSVQLMAEDVQRSVEYHYSQPGAQEVSQVFVSGEGALVSGLESYLGELLGIPAHRGNPLQKLAANRSNVPDEQLQVMEPVLAIALGLAIEEA